MSLHIRLQRLSDKIDEMWVCNERLSICDSLYREVNELALRADIYYEHLVAAKKHHDLHIFSLMEARLNQLYKLWTAKINQTLN